MSDAGFAGQAMGWQKKRDQRRTISLTVQLRHEDGWFDVTIADVSSRGLMIKSARPPNRGTFIEVCHRSVRVVGQVVWSTGNRFGVRTQDPIDLEALSQGAIAPMKRGGERGTVPRSATVAQRTTDIELTQASKRFAVVFNWVVVAAAGALAAALVADVALTTLKAPLDAAMRAMGGPR